MVRREHARLRVRLGESHLFSGIGLGILCVICAIALGAQFFRDGRNLLLQGLPVAGLFALGSFYLIALRVWGYVELNDHEIIQQGAWTIHRLPFSEVETVEWKWMGRLVILRSSTKQITLEPIRSFERGTSLPFIELLRERTTHAEHKGWAEFVHQVALPLRIRRDKPEDVDSETHVWSTRKRTDRFMGIVCVLFAAIGVATAFMLQHWKFLTFPIPLFALWMLLRFSIPKNGKPQQRLSANPDKKRLTSLACWGLVNLVGILAAKVFGVNVEILIGWAIFAYVGQFLLGLKLDLEKFERTKRNAAKSLEEWNRGKSGSDAGFPLTK